MQAVGRLGSYISRGVYTVSDSFHPFGGAVDIVLVQQQDGSFKSSPWYVRFGKFQGVLKAKEKVVSINVNGAEANFHMYLDNKGQAFFLREVEVEEGESIMYPSSSGDERDIQDKKHHLMPKSFSFDSEKSNSMAQVDINKGNVLARTNSDGSMINGLVIGDNNFQREVHNAGIRRLGSLECAEIAANLLEVKWSTNLAGHKPPRKDRPKTRKSKSQHDNTENSSNQRKLYEKAYSRNEQEGLYSNSDLEVARGLSEDTGVCSSCLSTADEVSFTKQKVEVITEVSMSIGTAEDTEHDTKVKEVISDGTRCDLEVACQEIKASNEKRQPSGEDVSGVSIMPGNGIAEEDISPNGVQLLVYRETSESLIGRVDYSSQCNHDVLYPTNKRCGPVHAQAEALQATTSLLPEVTKTEEVTMNAEVGVPVMEVCQTSQQTNYPHPGVSNVANIEDQTTLPRTVNLDLGLCSAEKDESNCIAKTSSYSSLGDRALEEKISRVEDVSSTLTSPLPPGDCVLGKSSRPPSPSSEEKLFLSSDHDDSTFKDQFEGSNSSEYVYKEDKHSYSFHLSPESQMTDLGKMSVTSSHTVIPKNKVAGEEDRQLTNSLPSSMHSHSNTLDLHDLCYPLNHLQDSRSPILEQPLLGKDDLKCLKPDDQLLPEEPVVRDNNSSEDAKSTAMNPPFGDSSAPAPSPSGNWRLWPFSFRRSSPETVIVPALDAKDTNASESSVNTDADKNELKPKLLKRNIRANTPTSEQLASLNLKEGRNIVIFTFSTAMLGCQQVDAQIYLWKWNTRIVISDVDGTITKSDVLGQVMPLVGVDWSQTGVTHLFSAIKENGYELLFLSARAISQAYRTRQFLGNLKQDGKVLPGGPVVISPDGLFPSLFREVIRRAPHEFKIACLEDIKALFPPDCNPFYAGFGNRDTDEISYLKVGIPKGKIFIINPKGEVVVNHRHDTKSYTSLHALVNGMFPPTNSFEQEDFNSWNYWKIPPPLIGN